MKTKHVTKPLIIATVFSLMMYNAHGATYYVKANGSNSNSGASLSQAWATVGYAEDRVSPGDIVYIKAGVYAPTTIDHCHGKANNYITFKAYPGDELKVRFSSGSYNTGQAIYIRESSYLTIEGLRAHTTFVGMPIRASHHINVQHCKVDDIGQTGIQIQNLRSSGTPPSHDINILYNEVAHTGKKSGLYAEGIYIGHGAGLHSGDYNILVKGNRIHHTTSEAIDLKVPTHGITIEDNIIHDIRVSSQGAITVHYNENVYAANPNITIRRNIVYNVARSRSYDGYGIFLGGQGLCYNNLVYNTVSYGIRTIDRRKSGRYTCRIYNNTVYNKHGNDIGIDKTAPHVNYYAKNNIGKGLSGYPDNIDASPVFFVDPNNADFHLLGSAAQAIGKGVNLSAYFTDDLERNTRSSFDMGCYAYGPGCGKPDDFATVGRYTTQGNLFTAKFNAKALSGNSNGTIGLTSHDAVPSLYSDMACIVRFNKTGTVDIRDGDRYTARAIFGYTPNTIYNLEMAVDPTSQTYHVKIKENGGAAWTVLADGYAFRGDYTGNGNFGHAVKRSSVCPLEVANFQVVKGGDVCKPANLALNGTIHSTSGQQAGYPAANLIDGISANEENRWSSIHLPQWAIIDLGAAMDIEGFVLHAYQNRAYRYTIHASADIADVQNNAASALVVDRGGNSTKAPITDKISAVRARYIKLQVTGAADYDGPWCSLHELTILGCTVSEGARLADDGQPTLPDVHPNPSKTGIYTLRLKKASWFAVMDPLGRVLVSRWAQKGSHSIDLSNYRHRFYILRTATRQYKLVKP